MMEHDNRLGAIDERDNDVDTRLERSVVTAQTLNDFCFRLGNNHKCHFGEDYHTDDNGNQDESHNVHNLTI